MCGGARRALVPLMGVPLMGVACTQFEPPVDLDTSTGDSESGGGVADEVVFDGAGKGQIEPARMRDVAELGWMPLPSHGLVIGAPTETWETVVGAGQASLLLDNDLGELAPPAHSPSTYVEDTRASSCPPEQRFAWDLLPNRGLGGSITYFSRNLGGSYGEYENVPLLSAPTAGADSGRVMVWLRCLSCAIFPKPDGVENVQGGRFGAAATVGVVEGQLEKLFIGSPARGNGEVAVMSEPNFRRWDAQYHWNFWGMDNGTRECQCDDQPHPNDDCLPFDEILVGSFPDEEFGAALVTADFDCDGIDELVVGAPGAALPDNRGGMIDSAGAVYVFRSHDEEFSAEAPLILRQGAFEVGGTPESGDRFGQTLVAGNFQRSAARVERLFVLRSRRGGSRRGRRRRSAPTVRGGSVGDWLWRTGLHVG